MSAPKGPYYHQWVKRITVNGMDLSIDRGSHPYPNHPITSNVPVTEKTRITIEFCDYTESSDPGREPSNKVNILALKNDFGIAQTDQTVWYKPKDPTKIVSCSHCIMRVNLQDIILMELKQLDPNTKYAIYTKSIGPGATNISGDQSGSAVSYRSCFRNPDTWIFCTGSQVSKEISLTIFNNICPICLDEGDAKEQKEFIITTCGHLFHQECIKQTKSNLCPICRKQRD